MYLLVILSFLKGVSYIFFLAIILRFVPRIPFMEIVFLPSYLWANGILLIFPPFLGPGLVRSSGNSVCELVRTRQVPSAGPGISVTPVILRTSVNALECCWLLYGICQDIGFSHVSTFMQFVSSFIVICLWFMSYLNFCVICLYGVSGYCFIMLYILYFTVTSVQV